MTEERVTNTKEQKITLADGKEYTVRKLTLADTQRLLPFLAALDEKRTSGRITVELIQLMIDVSYEILHKHNPELQKETMAEILELDSVYSLIAMCSSGNA